MKSGFKKPDAIKKQDPMDFPKDYKNKIWDHVQPQYDQRSSCFVNAGTHYGVGNRQPVGHTGNPKKTSDVIPMGRVNTMRIDEAG